MKTYLALAVVATVVFSAPASTANGFKKSVAHAETTNAKTAEQQGEVSIIRFDPGCDGYFFMNGVWEYVAHDCIRHVPAFVFDAPGVPHVACYTPAEGLIHVFKTQGGWVKETADPGPGIGQFPSIATGNNRVYVSAYDSTNADLTLATRSPGGNWAREVVDSNGDVGRWTSLTNVGGVLAVSYYDATHGDLKFASKPGPNWIIETVDTVGNVGGFTSLVARGPNFAVSYYDFQRGDLKVAKRIGGVWAVELVDTTGNVGHFCSMVALGTHVGDSLEIAYYDQTHADLKLAQELGSWSAFTADAVGDVGTGASATVSGPNPTDSVYVTYVDHSQGVLYLLRHAIGTQLVGVPTNIESRPDAWVRCLLDAPRGIRIRYRVPDSGLFALTIYDLQGRLVATPVRRFLAPGEYEHVWRGEGYQGTVSAGVYFVRITGPGVGAEARAVLLR